MWRSPGIKPRSTAFLVYVNDLPNCLETTKASMFADDTNLVCYGQSAADTESKLDRDMENLYKWLTANKLTLNKEKTEYILVGSRQRLNQISKDLQININNQAVKQVLDKKVLGVIIDEQLNWNANNDTLCKTISKTIAMLRRAKKFVTEDILF